MISGKQLTNYGTGINIGISLHLSLLMLREMMERHFYILEYEKMQRDSIYHSQVYKISIHYLSICQEKGIQSMAYF